MKFTFKTGIYLIVATTIVTLVAIGGAYQLSVAERVEQAKADAQSQRIIAKLEELVSAKEAAASATLNYLVSRSDQELEQLRKSSAPDPHTSTSKPPADSRMCFTSDCRSVSSSM